MPVFPVAKALGPADASGMSERLEVGSTGEWLAGSWARLQPGDSWGRARSAGSPAAGKAVGLGRRGLARGSDSSLLYSLNQAARQKEARVG